MQLSRRHARSPKTHALISYLVWHDTPGLPMLIGGSLIIGSGLLIALAARTAPLALFPGVTSK